MVNRNTKVANMANEPTVSDLIAERLRGLLADRKMTVRELAGRCEAIGMPKLTAQALYKLVGQRDRKDRPPRPVTVDELLVLAYALDINPLYLICGLHGHEDEDEDEIWLTPERPLQAQDMWNWLMGWQVLPGMDKETYTMSLPPEMRGQLVRTREDVLELVDRRLGELSDMRKDLAQNIERSRNPHKRIPGGSEG